MRILFTKYNLFLLLSILACAGILIFVPLKKNTVVPPNATENWKNVYHRAYNLGITTIPNIEEANPDGTVYRKFAAKMVSLFAMKVF